VNTQKDDRIFLATRLVAALVVPVLVLAFIILYFSPGLSGQRFAWEIQPSMTARFMGAGYLGGAWLFANAIFGHRWHRVAAGFLPVTTFTAAMLLATILHWSRFDLGHFPFQVWLVLYIATPYLVPWLWLRNRLADPGTQEADDLVVPALARWSLGLLGAFLLGFALLGFASPAWLISAWPWTLTPLTARVLGGWLALLGVGGLVISRDRRWSAWRVGLQSIVLWQLLVVVAALLSPADFKASLVNWYLISVLVVLVGMVVLFVQMEFRRRKATAGRPQQL